MTHLKTIINRVRNRVKIGDYGMLFEQAVMNLIEYISLWDNDFTKKERAEAIMLFDKYVDKVKHSITKSNKSQLEKVIEFRSKI